MRPAVAPIRVAEEPHQIWCLVLGGQARDAASVAHHEIAGGIQWIHIRMSRLHKLSAFTLTAPPTSAGVRSLRRAPAPPESAESLRLGARRAARGSGPRVTVREPPATANRMR